VNRCPWEIGEGKGHIFPPEGFAFLITQVAVDSALSSPLDGSSSGGCGIGRVGPSSGTLQTSRQAFGGPA